VTQSNFDEVPYDVIVIGAGISGLGLSALLAKAGKRVLTLEWARHIGGRAHSFEFKGHVTNVGGPRAGLADGKVDAMFARIGVEPGERGFFEDVKTFRNGEFISLPTLAMQGDLAEAAKMMSMSKELAESDDLAKYDAMTGQEWIEPLVKSPEVYDTARYAAIVMNTIPRLEDMAASALFEAMRIIQTNPRIFLAAHGYGDFMRILAEASTGNGGEIRTSSKVTEILIENGRVRGVVVDSQGKAETIEAPVVVAALPVWELFEMADESAFPKEFVSKVKHLNRTTAIFGLTVAAREPLFDGKFFVLTDGRRCGHPISAFMASNIAPAVAAEGEHLFEVCCQCDMEIGDDPERLDEIVELLQEDLEEMFPGWQEKVIWQKSYFHWEEPARTAGRAGVFRPEVKAPGVEGLYLTGDTVASRALPGLECAADSAMMCAEAILSR
jgi:phytoene dehydrogenase-like protein